MKTTFIIILILVGVYTKPQIDIMPALVASYKLGMEDERLYGQSDIVGLVRLTEADVLEIIE